MKKSVLVFTVMFFSLLGYAKNKTWTCLNEKGEVAFTTEAVYVDKFKNGLAKVYKDTLIDNKWTKRYGFINQKGKIVIPSTFEKANDFESNVTWVKYTGANHFVLIDKRGAIIPTKKYEKVKRFYIERQNLCAVFEDGKMGFVNEKGVEVIPCEYGGTAMFTEGLISVFLKDDEERMYGFINEQGELDIPFQFKQEGTSVFTDGLARATVGGKTVLINKLGEVVFKTEKGNIQGYKNGLVLVHTKKDRKGWGWLNLENEFVIKPIYDHAVNFNKDGYAVVEKSGLKGAIDTTGKVVLPLIYGTVYVNPSQDGYILGVYPSTRDVVMANVRKDYFTADFKQIDTDNIKFLKGAMNSKLVAFSNKAGKLGYLNRDLKVVIEPKYQRAFNFSEGFAWVVL